MAQKARLFTGLQPSGSLHIGNYFGALKPFVDTYRSYESFLCAVDYHALTTTRDAKTLSANTDEIVLDYLAAGVEPEHAILFRQSDVAEHTELAWIFGCLVPVAMLELAHAYKDAAGKGKDASAGLFTYPVLMAADIALYDAEIVPVGEDQRQHIEYTRDIIGKFNSAYGQIFSKPSARITSGVSIVPGTDGRKMSKSYGNTIPLFGTRDEIAKSVMGIVTDSAGKRPEHVYAIHKLVKGDPDLESLYDANQGNYKALKEALIEDLDALISPMRERRAVFANDPARIEIILEQGAEAARTHAAQKMEKVRRAIGVRT